MNSENVELSPQMREHSPRLFDIGPNGRFTVPVIHVGEHCRKTVFIEAGTHAREWISVSTALNCIYQLTERYTRNIEVLRKLRFIIVPLVNPDGYEYSRTKVRKDFTRLTNYDSSHFPTSWLESQVAQKPPATQVRQICGH